jgi:serine/threonine protein kinase
LLTPALPSPAISFGLSRFLEGSDTVSAISASVPWRWTDPLVAREERFRRETDVWAFGVCLWEMLSRGDSPYGEIDDTLAVLNFVSAGGRLATPNVQECGIEADSATVDALARVMVECWNEDLSQRPTFKRLAQDLKSLGQNTTTPEGLGHSRVDANTGQSKEYSLITTVGHGEYTAFGASTVARVAPPGGSGVPAHYGSIVDDEPSIPHRYGPIISAENGTSSASGVPHSTLDEARAHYDSIVDGNEIEDSEEDGSGTESVTTSDSRSSS